MGYALIHNGTFCTERGAWPGTGPYGVRNFGFAKSGSIGFFDKISREEFSGKRPHEVMEIGIYQPLFLEHSGQVELPASASVPCFVVLN